MSINTASFFILKLRSLKSSVLHKSISRVRQVLCVSLAMLFILAQISVTWVRIRCPAKVYTYFSIQSVPLCLLNQTHSDLNPCAYIFGVQCFGLSCTQTLLSISLCPKCHCLCHVTCFVLVHFNFIPFSQLRTILDQPAEKEINF